MNGPTGAVRRLRIQQDDEGIAPSGAVRTNQTSPISTRSLDMLLLHEELARAQTSQRHAELAESMRLARLAAARRRQRRAAASAHRRMRLALAAAR